METQFQQKEQDLNRNPIKYIHSLNFKSIPDTYSQPLYFTIYKEDIHQFDAQKRCDDTMDKIWYDWMTFYCLISSDIFFQYRIEK